MTKERSEYDEYLGIKYTYNEYTLVLL